MRMLLALLLLLLLTPRADAQGPFFGRLGPGGGGATLISQDIQPRVWGLSPATIPLIATKINNYYSANPIASYSILPGSFGDGLTDIDSRWGAPVTIDNALQLAAPYCLVAHLLPFLTTGGATGINPAHTATEYGNEGARLAVAITAAAMTSADGAFPGRLAVPAYSWCFNWMDGATRLSVGGGLMQFQSNCDALYPSWFSADSHKSCSAAILDAASAVAGAPGAPGAWGTAMLAQFETKWASSDTGIMGAESRVGNLYPSQSGQGYAGSCMTSGMAYINYSQQYDILGTETYRFAATTLTRAQFYQPNSTYSFMANGAFCLNNLLRPYARTLANGFYPNNLVWSQIRYQYGTTDQVSLGIWGYTAFSVMGTIWNDAGDTQTGRLATWIQRNRMPYDFPSSFRIPYAWLTRWTMEDPTIPATGPATLNVPLSTRTGDGRFVFRSAHDGDATTNQYSVVQFYASNFSVPGDGREAGAWSGHLDLYRKGPGLIFRGGGAHLAFCHGCLNTLIFQNTARVAPWSSNGDWANKHDGRALCCSTQPQPTNRGADIVLDGAKDYLPTGYLRNRFATGNVSFDYVGVDRSRWYTKTGWYTTATSPASETVVKDAIVNFRPLVATGDVHVARRVYVVNTSNQWVPTMGWNPSADAITTNGSGPTTGGFNTSLSTGFGQLKYTNASILTASSAYNLSGYTTSTKNTLTVVLPAAATIVVAGGPDETAGQCTFVNTFGGMDGVTTPNNNTSLEGIDVYGFRWSHEGAGQCADPEARSLLGIYGAFIQPTSIPNGVGMDFLFCYQLGDNGSTPGTCTTLTGLTNAIGVQWRDSGDQHHLAVFGAQGNDQSTMGFTVPAAGTYVAAIADRSGTTATVSSAGSCATVTNLVDGSSGPVFPVETASHTLALSVVTAGANCAVTVGP